jgi:hypothetical protein
MDWGLFYWPNQGTLAKGEGSVQLTLVLTSLDRAAFENESITYFLTKRASLMRRSTVLNLPLQLVFPGLTILGTWLSYFKLDRKKVVSVPITEIVVKL